ncbi:hypothetical protein HBI76_061870 [Parastagonospora nodorum]|nr:hypothetical protein HBI76_061870 [Parastagonospora nodorum]
MAPTNRDKLLKLDSSAHLRSYRRNLGPFRANGPVEISGEQEQGTGVRWTCDIVDLGEMGWTRTVNHEVHAIQEDYPAPSPIHIRAPAVLSQTAAPAVQPPMFPHHNAAMPHARNTVPPLLRAALEHGKTFPNDDALYEVFEETASAYMSDESQVVSTHRGLRAANERAVGYFVETYMCAAVDEPEVELKNEGMISCTVETDGSLGGNSAVYVRRAKVGEKP